MEEYITVQELGEWMKQLEVQRRTRRIELNRTNRVKNGTIPSTRIKKKPVRLAPSVFNLPPISYPPDPPFGSSLNFEAIRRI